MIVAPVFQRYATCSSAIRQWRITTVELIETSVFTKQITAVKNMDGSNPSSQRIRNSALSSRAVAGSARLAWP